MRPNAGVERCVKNTPKKPFFRLVEFYGAFLADFLLILHKKSERKGLFFVS